MPATATLGECLSLMRQREITSVPVYSTDKKYLGIVSCSDILAKTVFLDLKDCADPDTNTLTRYKDTPLYDVLELSNEGI